MLGYAIASKKILQQNLPILWIYREQPDDEQDSGWRFFSGNEDQDYMNNPDNFQICDVDSLIAIEPSITSFLKELPGVEFERESEFKSWIRINS